MSYNARAIFANEIAPANGWHIITIPGVENANRESYVSPDRASVITITWTQPVDADHNSATSVLYSRNRGVETVQLASPGALVEARRLMESHPR